MAAPPAARLLDGLGTLDGARSLSADRLPQLAAEIRAYLVDTAGEIDAAWLDDVATAGVTSGASEPGVLVEQVRDRLAVHGYQDVALLNVADESRHFAPPRELCRNTARRP
ncbi:hypothetical protein AB0D14_32525 [Streptomyces sp. NPDC048484]|uniref:hypothetical protein n=1 Tax=Streptomyces sp. NPDC048484 TaxID=3155146 RepID=UPI00341BBBF4